MGVTEALKYHPSGLDYSVYVNISFVSHSNSNHISTLYKQVLDPILL